ncbi:MAG: amidohydrolase family protein [Acidobacteriota bacterium]
MRVFIGSLRPVFLLGLFGVLFLAPAAAETVAVRGATVHTLGPSGTLENATLVIENGVLRAVGLDLEVPSGARVIDATGKVVTPGLIDSVSRLGLIEISLESSTVDSATEDPRWTAAFEVVDAVNPASALIAANRVEGLTRAVVAPQARSGPVAGLGAAIHLGSAADPVVLSPAAMFAVYGEEGARRAGGSRAAALARLRELFEDARDFGDHGEAFARGERREYSASRKDLEALQPVIAGELPFAVYAHRASDIRAMLRLGTEFDLRLVLIGATEAWKVAPELAAAGVPVVLNPFDNLPASFERLGATVEAASRLHAAGVTIAFYTGDAHNARNLRQGAGNAVAYGLPWEVALAAMTSAPAEIWGLADSWGTLEPGMEADLVVWDGDPLEVTSFPEHIFIRGEEISLENRQTRLRDRYRDLEDDTLPVYRVNPSP